jgi:hypothetical protein
LQTDQLFLSYFRKFLKRRRVFEEMDISSLLPWSFTVKFYSFCFSMLALTLLTSCGDAGKSKAKLEITHSFALGGANGGGTIVVASHTNGNKISIALDTDLQKTVTLEKGVWTFTVVGWDGNGNGNKFRGVKSCGTSIADLNSDAATVEIISTPANCTLQDSTLAFKNVAISSCGIFKTYLPNQNTYQDFTDPIAASFCLPGDLMPSDYLSPYTHYRVFSVNHYNNSTSLGFSSTCLTANDIDSGLNFPTQIIPFAIRTYKSLTECDGQVGNSQMFQFKDGLAPGNPSDFEHKFADVFNATVDYLVLPSSFTRRGSSPFMAEIPRILCGTNSTSTSTSTSTTDDCITEPEPVNNFYVKWKNEGGNSKVIARNVAPNFCTNSLFPNLYKFNFKNCSVEDGNLRGNFSKNELLCPFRETDDFIWDISVKNEHFYLLTHNRVAMFSKKGTLVASLDLGTSQPYRKIVVNPTTGDIFLTSGTGIYKATWNNSTKKFSSLNSLTGPITTMTVHELEVVGGFLFVAGVNGPDYNIKVYSSVNGDLVNGAFIANSPLLQSGGSIGLKQLIYVNDPVLSIASSLKLLYTDGTKSFVKSYPVNLTGLPMVPSTPTTSEHTGIVESFWYDSGKFFLTTSSGFEWTDDISLNFNSVTLTTTPPKGIVALDNSQVFVINADGVLAGGTFDSSMNPIVAQQINLAAPNVCTESSTPLASFPVVSIHSQRDEAIHNLTEDALDMFGRRSFTPSSKVYSYFDRLGDEGEDDNTRTGGKLARVQQMLSPLAIGSFFSDKANCAALVSDIQSAGGSLTRSRRLYNNLNTKWMDVAVTATSFPVADSAAAIPLKYGVAGDPINNPINNTAIVAYFDLKLEFTGTDMDGSREKTHMKIKCGSKVGTLESVDTRSGETRREFYIYNTGDISNSRYEEYTRRDKDNETEVSMSKILKYPSGNFMGRTVQAKMEDNPMGLVGKTEGSSTEVHFESSPSLLKTVNYKISDTTLTAFKVNNVGDFGSIRDVDESSPILTPTVNAPGCIPAANTIPIAPSVVYGLCQGVPTLSPADSNTAFGIPLAISNLIDAKDSVHPFNLLAPGVRIFTIPAP